ncbi:DUF2637 domain-containing protein [Pseudonocardia sp. ICBG601]|uniref:DUF2637 domain-containing protein n=1 Tax=Pseudonocardia sp. ICBG601 TaxID=2846759 RepID=UPI001CF6DCA5|nr:DUF2637 domain-containing protein [Pseudonocardia sp. ICBG601]
MTVHELRPTSGNGEPGVGSAGELWAGREQQLIPEENLPQSGRARQTLWASVWPRVLAVLVVGSVGLPAAVASYWHLQEVAARFNPGSALAYWLPLSVDGLLAAALVGLWSRRTRGERVGFGPWAAFAFGMIVTLLANAASVVPESEWVRDGSVLASVAAWMVALFPAGRVRDQSGIDRDRAASHPRCPRCEPDGGAGRVAGGAARWTAPAAPAGQVSTAAVGAAHEDRSESSAISMQSMQSAWAVEEPGADQGDTAPLPVVTSGPARRQDTPEGGSDDAAACTAVVSAVGETGSPGACS